jgi:toxin ParE1/3/4
VPEVVFAATATEDLRSIYRWVAAEAGAEVAQAYVGRLRTTCLSLADFPNRGRLREDVARDLRTLSFEKRAIIAYRPEDERVRVLRILHHGKDLAGSFGRG